MVTTGSLPRLRGVILDWAGTTVDHGSRAPAIVFQEIFRQRGIHISAAQSREPMGRAKRDHIAAIAAMPEVAASWLQVHGVVCGEHDIDAMYDDFLPLQKSILLDYSQVIEGVVDAVNHLRGQGLKIGSTTGYTSELMEVLTVAAANQGYAPEVTLCSEDAPRGRPAPYLLWKAATLLDIYPMSSILCIDDTPVGIEAGRHAGCWTIGVTRTGNCLGLSQAEVDALSETELRHRCDQASLLLKQAGAHETIESVAHIGHLMPALEARLARGERP
jgi:phosphonoacetaldehyde hydrolase